MTAPGEHALERPQAGLWRCAICLWGWSYRPKTACPGLPRYGPGRPEPAHLKTKTALKKAGKRPGGPARGAVLQTVSNEYHKLYDEREAAPRRKVTDAQTAALASGREEAERRRRCSRCGGKLTVRERRQGLQGICERCVLVSQHEENREASVRWARDLLASGGFVVADFETTGLEEPDIVEAAVVGPSGDVLFRSYLRPAIPVGPEARAVHGIPDATLLDAPDIGEVHEEILRLFAGRAVVCYNAAFDGSAWRASCARRGLPAEPGGAPVRWEDAMGRYADFVGGLVPLPSGDHSARGDALATLALIREMAADVGS